jgi:hypothetical protein
MSPGHVFGSKQDEPKAGSARLAQTLFFCGGARPAQVGSTANQPPIKANSGQGDSGRLISSQLL